MPKLALLFLLMLWGGVEAYSQEHGPDLLHGASHCLAVEDVDWLAVQRTHVKFVRMGYAFGIETEPGERHIYVIAYEGARRSSGKIFDVFYYKKGRKTLFDVQNNASFKWSGKLVDFVDTPLGGVWTQTHLLTAVKRAGWRPVTQFSVKDLSKPNPDVTCRSYVNG